MSKKRYPIHLAMRPEWHHILYALPCGAFGPAEGVLIGILFLNIGCWVEAAGSLTQQTQQGLQDQNIKELPRCAEGPIRQERIIKII